MQTIYVQVKPGSSQQKIEKHLDLQGNEIYIVRLHARPVAGQANQALREMLSDFFSIPKTKISIAKGATSTYKRVILLD